MKKKSRRSQTKNAAIDPNLNLRTRIDEISDIKEYFHTLPDDAKRWMNSYTENIVNASFNRKNPSKNLITPAYTKKLIKLYLRKFKKSNDNKEVVEFIKKYLIRKDNVPLRFIHSIFFEEDEAKLLKLTHKLKDAILDNIGKAKKREVNKIVKIIERETYKNNNSRNNCILTRERAGGALEYLEEITDNSTGTYNMEDVLIRIFDKENEEEQYEASLLSESNDLDDCNNENCDSSDSSEELDE